VPSFSRTTWLVVTLGLSAVILVLDYLSGPYIQFPILFVIPVVLAAWYHGLSLALSLSLALPVLRLAFLAGRDQIFAPHELINTLTRMIVLGLLAYFVERTAQHERALSRELRVLEGMLPICGFCKKIRDEAGSWHTLEGYITEHSEAVFSHGVCPDCERKHYGA
jgi:hypothetical protein